MKTSKSLVVAMAGLSVAGWGMAAHADAAGKAKFDAVCAECHEAADFEGEDAKALTDTIKKIVAGQQKHKSKLALSDAEAASVAAFMASGGK